MPGHRVTRSWSVGLVVVLFVMQNPSATTAQVAYEADRAYAVYVEPKISKTPRTTLVVGEAYSVYRGDDKFCALVSDTYGFVGYVPASLIKVEFELGNLPEYDLEEKLDTIVASYVGTRIWTKWDILYIDNEGGLFGSLTDEEVTRFKAGSVIYQSHKRSGDTKQISTTNAEEFALQFNAELNREAAERRKKTPEAQVGESLVAGKKRLRLAEAGTPLTIVNFGFRLNEVTPRVEVELKDLFEKDYEVWLFADDGYGLSPGILETMLLGMFSRSDPGAPVEISLGMSMEDLIRLKGEPITKINLGAKTILTYDDVKFILENGALVDAQ